MLSSNSRVQSLQTLGCQTWLDISLAESIVEINHYKKKADREIIYLLVIRRVDGYCRARTYVTCLGLSFLDRVPL
jgi:hypothetical protein